MNLLNSPSECLPLQFCILTNRPTPDVHDDSALLFLRVARLHTMDLPRRGHGSNICTAADSSAYGVGAVSGPPFEKAAMSFSFSPCSVPAKILLHTRFQKPASFALSASLLIRPFGNFYPILFRSGSILPYCYDGSAEETKIPLRR